MNPVVSIIIPAYNSSEYLPGAIESILLQTYKFYEIVIVNDGSIDNTEEVLKPYLDKIIYVRQENRGLSAARNTGFRTSIGNFICFLDADDLLLPNKFEVQLRKFQEEQDLGVVISSYYDVENDGKSIIQLVKKSWNRDGLQRLLNHEVFPPHTALLRREVMENSSLFPEDINTEESQEDWQLWLDIALHGFHFGSVPEPTCLYRRNVSGSISTNLIKHNDGARRVVRWLMRDTRATPYSGQVQRLAQIIEMERVARAWQAGEIDITREALVNAINTSLTFWLDPYSYNHLFYRSLSVNEQAEWMKNKDVCKFRNRVLKEILPLAASHVDNNIMRKIFATVELAFANMAYNWKDSQNRWKSLMNVLRLAPQYAFSRQAKSSTIRCLLGPSILEPFQKIRAIWS